MQYENVSGPIFSDLSPALAKIKLTILQIQMVHLSGLETNVNIPPPTFSPHIQKSLSIK